MARAAAQSDKSETEFILAAALEKAETCKPKPDATLEEMTTLLQAAQEKSVWLIRGIAIFCRSYSTSAARKLRVSEKALDASVYLAVLA